jgi:hypothetical protein
LDIGLKQANALLPLLFNFALEHTISTVPVKQGGTYQLLVSADAVNLLGESMYVYYKKNTEVC